MGELNDQGLRILMAKQAITEQIYRYCRGIDRMDLPLTLSVWHEDGTVDFGTGIAAANYTPGPAPVPVKRHFEWAWDVRRSWTSHSHQATNILIEVDGANARSETASIAVLQRLLPDSMIEQDIYWGRWLDTWSERDGRWAIDHRLAVADCYQGAKFPAGMLDQPGGRISRRNRNDPSYGFLLRG